MKLLTPLLTLTVFLGGFGVFLVIHDLSARAGAALDQDLARRSLDARSLLRDRELYLLESVNFASNLQGVTEAIRAKGAATAGRLMRSVLALKTDVNLVAATDANGYGLVEFIRAEPRVTLVSGSGTRWSDAPFVASALSDADGRKYSGFLPTRSGTMLAIAAPVCSVPGGCDAVGATIIGIRVDALADLARGETTAGSGDVGAAIYDTDGRMLARAGLAGAAEAAPPSPPQGQLRQTRKVGGREIATLYSALEVGGRRAGTVAISVPTAPAFASVRGTRLRFAILLLAGLAGAVVLGAGMTRLILRQVRPLVRTNRALGQGDLSSRAPVLTGDELGELAHGVNQMAEQLQAMYETLERQVAQRTEEVRRLLQERTEFFASISHELRTPLAVIQGKAKMLRDPTYRKSTRWTTETGKTIGDTTGQLLAVVNNILELARAESGRIEMNVQDVDLSGVVRDLRPTIEGLAKAGGLRVGISVPKDLPHVKADPDRLKEVLVNLIDNAVKYTPSGGRIALAATSYNGSVEVSVADTGVGIPDDAGVMIFEPFYRVKDSTPQRGQASSGLGLALAKRFVEAQGGRIWFNSEAGAGTTFAFTVNAVEPADAKQRGRS